MYSLDVLPAHTPSSQTTAEQTSSLAACSSVSTPLVDPAPSHSALDSLASNQTPAVTPPSLTPPSLTRKKRKNVSFALDPPSKFEENDSEKIQSSTSDFMSLEVAAKSKGAGEDVHDKETDTAVSYDIALASSSGSDKSGLTRPSEVLTERHLLPGNSQESSVCPDTSNSHSPPSLSADEPKTQLVQEKSISSTSLLQIKHTHDIPSDDESIASSVSSVASDGVTPGEKGKRRLVDPEEQNENRKNCHHVKVIAVSPRKEL